jgi:hypothetical protein
VAILQNRLRLFSIGRQVRERHVFAWSGGAMCLTDRVVLFHDRTPDGPGYPEVMDRGERLVPGVVVLPHARHRLDLEGKVRVALFARRFAPAVCHPMDERQYVEWRGETFTPGPGLRRLGRDGSVILEGSP